MNSYEYSSLWKSAFSPRNDGFDEQRSIISQAYKEFRGNVSLLLPKIQQDLPDLTIHDITHVDAMWQVASEIAGPDYPLNPAEALVLGGAFLLHDAAHCLAAFPNGVGDVEKTSQWRDSVAQRQYTVAQLLPGSEEFRAVLFDTLRTLHPIQAKNLPFARWGNDVVDAVHLFPNDILRDSYGHLIGEIAASHWSHPYELECFATRNLGAPATLSPADWHVSALKVALLLRVADAAHLDGRRAPKLLRVVNRPKGISETHWLFQERLHQVLCDRQRQELVFSGGPFGLSEQAAWWLAYDTATMVNHELRSADALLREHGFQRFNARGVAYIQTPESFSQNVRTLGWYPIDASIRIGNVTSVVKQFGGSKLYGSNHYYALRELLQNARDAVIASRALGALSEHEGMIEVEIEEREGTTWLHVQDSGIGMGRFVLTDVLLDFGKSLWGDGALSSQWPGLAATGYNAVGKFGIGFFSIFMLGDRVKVVTMRQSPLAGEDAKQWVLEFSDGLGTRPSLRQAEPGECLLRHGTRVSVALKDPNRLLNIGVPGVNFSIMTGFHKAAQDIVLSLGQLVGALAPASEIDIYTKRGTAPREKVITGGDWLTLSPKKMIERLAPAYVGKKSTIWGLKHFEKMFDSQGNCIGRAAATGDHSSSKFGFATGIVTTGGLFGGYINDITGVLAGSQDCLDRKTAEPRIDAENLIRWAEDQVTKLDKIQQLSLYNSNILIRLGATNEKLFLATHGNQEMTVEQFREAIRDMDEIFLVESHYFSFDSDDGVVKSEFESEFRLDSRVFGVKNISSNGFITELNWPKSLSPALPVSPWKIIGTVIEEVWSDGKSKANEIDEHVIGHVSTMPILRPITLVSRHRATVKDSKEKR